MLWVWMGVLKSDVFHLCENNSSEFTLTVTVRIYWCVFVPVRSVFEHFWQLCVWVLVNNLACVVMMWKRYGVSKCLSINILQRWLDPNKPIRKQLKSRWNAQHIPLTQPKTPKPVESRRNEPLEFHKFASCICGSSLQGGVSEGLGNPHSDLKQSSPVQNECYFEIRNLPLAMIKLHLNSALIFW